MMDKAILDFAKQFEYKPSLVNEANLDRKEKVIICGMGGSHLAANIIKDVHPELFIKIQNDYGLPGWSEVELASSLVILSSYSGNTEEVIESFEQAKKMGLPMAIIAVGGKLIELAVKENFPYVKLPDTGIQPRSALGFSLLGTLKLLGEEKLLSEVTSLATKLEPKFWQTRGQELANEFRGKVPVIYTSRANFSIAYNWKIKINETGKIPAFYNVVPELNHNEMTGFDVQPSVKNLTNDFYFIFIKDSQDQSPVQKRMTVLEKLYTDRGLPVHTLELTGKNKWERIFNSLLLADWTAYYTSQGYGLESEQVPMVEEFKKLIK